MTFHKIKYAPLLIVAVVAATSDAALAQVVQNYSYQTTNTMTAEGNNMIFGVAAYQICSIKNFMFMGVYVLAAIAFVLFAIKALFTKFEMKQFLPILGAIFVVAFSDLFIQFMSAGQGWYCPTSMSIMTTQ